MPSRTLGNLEFQILKSRRTEEDIPGWAIPKIYFDYLSTGDTGPLKRVIYHNAVDIVSLAALFGCINQILSQPTEIEFPDIADYFALGRLFEDIGDISTASKLYDTYLSGLDKLESDDSIDITLSIRVIMRLALIYKRDSEYPKAIPLWKHAAQNDHLPAFEELAKYYEHKLGDYPTALKWTSSAINLFNASNTTRKTGIYLEAYWLPRLEHRRDRLIYKIGRSIREEKGND